MASVAPSPFPQALAARLIALRNAWEKAIDQAPIPLPDLADILADGLTHLQRDRQVDQASLLELADQGQQLALRSATPAQALTLGQQLRRAVFEVTLWIDSRPTEERDSWAGLLQPRPVEGDEPAPPPLPPPEVAPGAADPSVPVPDDSWSPSPDEWTQGQEPPEAFLIEPAPPSSEWIEPPKPKPVRKPVHRRRPFRTRHIARPGDVLAGPDFSVAIHAIVDDVKGVLETQAVVPPPSVLDGVGRKLDAAGGEGLRSFLADQGDGSPDTAGMRRLVTRSTPDDQATQAVPPDLTAGPPPGDWSDLRADVSTPEAVDTLPTLPTAAPISEAVEETPTERPIPAWVAEVGQSTPAVSPTGIDTPSLAALLAEHRLFRRRARRLDRDVPVALLRQQVADLLSRDQADLVVKSLSERHDPTTPPLLREVAEYLQGSRPELAATCRRQADRIEDELVDLSPDEAVPAPADVPTAAPPADGPGDTQPLEAAVEAKLGDPEVTARLDDLHARYESGELETVSHEEMGESLQAGDTTPPTEDAITEEKEALLRHPAVAERLDDFEARLQGGDLGRAVPDADVRELVGLPPVDDPVTQDAIPTEAPASSPSPPPPVTGPVVWPPEPSLLTLIHRRHRRRRPGRPGRPAPVDPLAPLTQLREQTADHLRRNDLAVVTILTRDLPLHQGNQESADLLTEMGDYLAHSNPDLAVDCYVAAWTADGSHGQALARLANWNELHETPRLDPDLLLAVALQAEAIGHPTTAQAAREQIQTAGPTAWPAPPPPPAPADEKPIVWDP